jgi:hypothetical protein
MPNIQTIDTLEYLPSVITEDKVQRLEKEMLNLEQADCPVVHIFAPGIYIRQVTIDAGVFSIGHYHKKEHLNIMLAGVVVMINEDGTKTTLTAPQTFVAKPGRKIGYIVEKMVWQNVYATDETDVEKLEEMFLDKSLTWQDHQKAELLLLSCDKSEDVADYYLAIAEYGFTHDVVRQQVEDLSDQIEMPFGTFKTTVASSNIEGKGVFATSNIAVNEVIAPARIDGKRTPIGRYTNHAKNPNAVMVLKDNGDINLVAIKEIQGSKGSNLGEEITVDYRQVLELAKGRT